MPETPTGVKTQRKPVAVLYGSSTSQARAIAERVADNLRACGFPTDIRDLQALTGFDINRCIAAVLVAPVQQRKHEEAMVEFVKTHRAELDRLPVALPAALRSGDVQMAPNPFFAETGWHPKRVKSFAGAVSYMQYNFFVRAVMKLLAKRGAAGADTGANRQEAGWDALDVFVNEFVLEIREASADQPPA